MKLTYFWIVLENFFWFVWSKSAVSLASLVGSATGDVSNDLTSTSQEYQRGVLKVLRELEALSMAAQGEIEAAEVITG